jgi:pyruvate ferredoxin oxidoreductase gamma subunit
MDPGEMREATGFDTGKAYTVNASHIAIEEVGREVTNTPMLGAFARATGLFGLEEMAQELRDWFRGKLSDEVIEGNVRAMRRAADELQQG